MARTSPEISADYDFEVESQRLQFPDGNQTRMFGIRRMDTGDLIGVTTEQYGVVRNAELVEKVEECFNKRGMKYTKKLIVTQNGAQFLGQYDFKDMISRVPGVGDEMGLRLFAQNSYDRSKKVSFLVGVLRLICLNGAVTLDKEHTMTKRHSTKVDLDFINEALDSALGGFERSMDTFNLLASTKVDEEQGSRIITNLTQHTKLSDKLAEEINGEWLAPRYKEDKERNIYNLFNAATYHLTHNVAPLRFEYAHKLSKELLGTFVKAAQEPKYLSRLLELPKINAANN